MKNKFSHGFHRMVHFLVRVLFKTKNQRYIYGVIPYADGTVRYQARIDTKTGKVQFVLWKAGEQGHAEDFWHDLGSGWENYFKPNASHEARENQEGN